MRRKEKKVTCYSCGEMIDPELANQTEEGFLCDDCYDELEEDFDEEDDFEEDGELDFYDDDLDFDELEDEEDLDLYEEDES
jgi:recombinational DNA repair protein (RecF pathway)